MLKAEKLGISLVVQWLRICLPMQGTWVQSLVQELRSTCHRATKPQLLNLSILEPTIHSKRSRCNEKPTLRNKEEPLLATTRESPHTAMRKQRSQNKYM